MRAFAAAALTLFASAAFAQEGMYVGIGLGSFDYQEDAAFLAPRPFGETVSAWKAYGGFEFNDYFALEVRYGGTEKIEQGFSDTGPTLGAFTGTVDMDFTTTSAVAMGMFPRDWGVLIGGLGYFNTNSDAHLELVTECCGRLTQSASVSDDGIMAVLGLEWRFGRFGMGPAVRVEYEWLDMADADAATIGVGIAYRF
jgi:Outer membrane protein beta-barrel domain